MIGLYKDPKGENVFAQSNSGDAVDLSFGTRLSAQQQRQSQPTNEDALRRRIKQLESILSTYSVCYRCMNHFNIIMTDFNYNNEICVDEATVYDLALLITHTKGSKSISDSGIRLEVSNEHNSSKVDLDIHKQGMSRSDEDTTNSAT